MVYTRHENILYSPYREPSKSFEYYRKLRELDFKYPAEEDYLGNFVRSFEYYHKLNQLELEEIKRQRK